MSGLLPPKAEGRRCNVGSSEESTEPVACSSFALRAHTWLPLRKLRPKGQDGPAVLVRHSEWQ